MASSPRNGVRNTRIWLEPRTSWFTSPTGDSSTITRIRFRRGTVLPGMRSTSTVTAFTEEAKHYFK
jgi:hypothetical protein